MGTRFHSMSTGAENPPKENKFDMSTDRGRAEYITFVMSSLFAKVGEAAAEKIKEYADRIQAGEPKEKVFQGLGPTFINSIEELLKGYPQKTETNDSTPETIEALKEEKAELEKGLQANETLAHSLEEELKALENEEKTVDDKSKEALERINTQIETTAAKALEPSDEEKLAQIRKEILKENYNKRQEHLKDVLKTAQTEQEENVFNSRQAYTNAYGESIDKVNGLKKLGYKIGNFFGFNRKDSFTDNLVEKKVYDVEKDKTLTKRMADKVIKEKDATREKKRDWTIEEQETRDRRYQNILRKKGGEAFSKEKELEFVKTENEILRSEKKTEWEAHKNNAEHRMAHAQEWIQRNLDKNPKLKKAIGNRWVRLGATSVGMGLFTGGIGSVAFWGSRVVRATGGMIGAGTGKMIGDKFIKTEERIADKQAELEKDYKKGTLTPSEYDKRVEEIELLKIKLERAKNALTIGLGMGAGYGSGLVDAHYIHPTLTDTPHVGQTAPGTTTFTPENQKAVDELMKHSVDKIPETQTHIQNTQINDTISNQTPVDSIAPELNGGTKISLSENTPPATPTVVPTTINNDWLVHKGEGIENTFIRQIEQSEELQKLLGYKEGMNLHEFAGKAAHQMALSNGYVDGTGHEVRISGAGIDKVAYEMRINNGAVEIHEHFDGKEVEMHAGGAKGLEANIEDTKAEGGYEKMYDGSHHVNHTTQHIEALKKEINNSYPTPEPYHMDALHPAPYHGYPEPTPYKLGPNGITIHPINETPTIPTENTPEPVRATPGYQPRLPHTHQEPKIYGDPMHNAPGLPADPDAGRTQYLRSQMETSNIAGKGLEGNVATNTGMSFLDHLLKPFENIFNFDTTPTTPEIPNMTATPGGGLDDLSKAA